MLQVLHLAETLQYCIFVSSLTTDVMMIMMAVLTATTVFNQYGDVDDDDGCYKYW